MNNNLFTTEKAAGFPTHAENSTKLCISPLYAKVASAYFFFFVANL